MTVRPSPTHGAAPVVVVAHPPMATAGDDLCPPEIELARAVDRLEQQPWKVGDWDMVLETMRRVARMRIAARMNARARKVAL